MTATALPDEVLLVVFQHLDTPDLLLSVRGVCRRWRDLALSRAAWRHRDETAAPVPWLGAVLRLAPCLRLLELDDGNVHLVPLHDVKCVVSTLSIKFLFDQNADKVMCALRVLLSAGVLNLNLDRFAGTPYRLRTLLRAMRCSKLTGLSLFMLGTSGSTARGTIAIRGQSEATLQRLEYSCSKHGIAAIRRDICQPGVHAVEFLLQTHASTLTSVSLRDMPHDFPVALLTACVNLRELECEALADMSALLQCSGLDSLHLVTTHRDLLARPAIYKAVCEFFSGATGLTCLTFSPGQYGYRNLITDLLRVLAGTRRSKLTSLSAKNWFYGQTVGEGVDYVSLGALLPAFPNLARLVLTCIGVASGCWPRLVPMLRAISPATTPLLRFLELGRLAVCPAYQDEPSPGLYIEDIRAMMMKNPVLHLTGLVVCEECRENRCLQRLQCTGCWTEGAGKVLGFFDVLYGTPRFGLYSHDSDDPCDLHTGYEWLKLEAAGHI